MMPNFPIMQGDAPTALQYWPFSPCCLNRARSITHSPGNEDFPNCPGSKTCPAMNFRWSTSTTPRGPGRIDHLARARQQPGGLVVRPSEPPTAAPTSRWSASTSDVRPKTKPSAGAWSDASRCRRDRGLTTAVETFVLWPGSSVLPRALRHIEGRRSRLPAPFEQECCATRSSGNAS